MIPLPCVFYTGKPVHVRYVAQLAVMDLDA